MRMRKGDWVALVLLLVALGLILVLALAIPAHAATPATLVGTLSWSDVEGRHVQLTTGTGIWWALIGATPAIQTTLEAGATAGRHARVRGHVAEVSIYGVPTLIVYQAWVCPH